ncbi:MAG: A24 family peptidase [Coriobacteriales bacterium]|nr:A24 family peptidase [Coriobacteriales bacterium]
MEDKTLENEPSENETSGNEPSENETSEIEPFDDMTPGAQAVQAVVELFSTNRFAQVLAAAGGALSYLAFLPPSGFLSSAFGFAPGFTPSNLLCAIFYALIVVLLVAIAFIDQKTQHIPNILSLCLLGCGVLSYFVWPPIEPFSRLIGLLLGGGPFLLLSLVVPGSFGMGDVKLMAACGLILGWEGILIAACIGILIGGVQGIYFLTSGKKESKEHFAFAPALCIGVVVAMFAGQFFIQALF